MRPYNTTDQGFKCSRSSVGHSSLLVKVSKTRTSDVDPGSGSFLNPGSGLDKKNKIWIRPDHISENLHVETIFWVKILKFFEVDADPDPGSGINTPNPQHCKDLAVSLKFFFAVLHMSEVHDVNIMF
jgi:hypothetical protein